MPPIRTQAKKRRAVALPRALKTHERATAAAQRDIKSTVVAPAQATSVADRAPTAPEAAETYGSRELEEICESSAAAAVLIANGADAACKTSKLTNRGREEASFRDNQEWETNHQNWLGIKTKMVTFGSGFVLKDEHINELISVGPHLCRNLTHFTFRFDDVSYGATNSAQELTDETVIRLVKLCPNLRSMQLQGTSGLKDITLEALFRYCPDISYIELTTHSRHGKIQLDGSALDKLREHPCWGTKLKTLRLPRSGYNGRDPLTRAVRALTKQRIELLVQLVSVSESKKWGDWELESWHDEFRKGRKQHGF